MTPAIGCVRKNWELVISLKKKKLGQLLNNCLKEMIKGVHQLYSILLGGETSVFKPHCAYVPPPGSP